MEASIMKHAVVLMQTSSLDRSFHRSRSTLSKVNSLVGRSRSQFREFSSQQSRGFRGKVVRYIGHFVQLGFEGRNHLGVIESQIDAFVSATQIENFASIRSVDPTPLHMVHGNGSISLLPGPALHHVAGLELGEIDRRTHQ